MLDMSAGGVAGPCAVRTAVRLLRRQVQPRERGYSSHQRPIRARAQTSAEGAYVLIVIRWMVTATAMPSRITSTHHSETTRNTE